MPTSRGSLTTSLIGIIMTAVAAEVADANILRLVRNDFLPLGVDGERCPHADFHRYAPKGASSLPCWPTSSSSPGLAARKSRPAFVRYAANFVASLPIPAPGGKAWLWSRQVLEKRAGLQLSREKTKVTSYGKGTPFWASTFPPRSRRMRPKSDEKSKTKSGNLLAGRTISTVKSLKTPQPSYSGDCQYFPRFFHGPRGLP